MKAITKTKEFAKKAKDSYKKPTPKKWKLIGETIQDIGIVVGAIGALTNPWVGVIALGLGKIGKLLSRFASE
jgi:hypothetical protein